MMGVIACVNRLWQLLQIKDYDIVVIQRELIPFGFSTFERLVARRYDKLIYDIDDAFFTAPHRSSALRRIAYDPEKPGKIIGLCKHTIVGNHFLQEYALHYTSQVTVIPTSVDLTHYQPKVTHNTSKVTIGWVGTPRGFENLAILEGVWRRLRDKHSFEVKVISSRDYHFSSVSTVNKRWSLSNEIVDLQELDVGVMPLLDSEFNKGKGGFKIIQYMAVGLPAVCSPVGMNSEIVEDGENGFLARNEDEWVDKLSRLIEDPGLRRKMGIRGRESIADRYSLRVNAPKLQAVLERVYRA